MNKQILLYLLILVTIGLGSIIGWGQIRAHRKLAQQRDTAMNSKATNILQRDPCWFMTLKDPTITADMIQKRQEQQIRGYPEEITLVEAIRVFNQEKQCNPTLAPYPLLTEEEVISAIVAGPGYGTWGEPWIAQQTALLKIVKDKKMPKGSLLVASGGPNISGSLLRPDGSIKARGIDIAMFIGLERHELGQELKREQIFEIRRTYFSVETVK